jgi:hypothetical protein
MIFFRNKMVTVKRTENQLNRFDTVPKYNLPVFVPKPKNTQSKQKRYSERDNTGFFRPVFIPNYLHEMGRLAKTRCAYP